MKFKQLLALTAQAGNLAEVLWEPWNDEPPDDPPQRSLQGLVGNFYDSFSDSLTDDDLRMLMHLSDARQCQPKFLILEVYDNLSRIDSLAQSKIMEEFLYRLSYLKCHCLITDAAPGRLRITHLGKNLLRVFSENDDLPNPKKKSKPKAFIGSSVEGLPLAQKLRALLEYDIRASIWNEGTVFGLGQSTMESLENAVQEFAFAIFLFTPDDQIITRRRKRPVARDNVLFELGLFTGKLGRQRSFIVHPSNKLKKLCGNSSS